MKEIKSLVGLNPCCNGICVKGTPVRLLLRF